MSDPAALSPGEAERIRHDHRAALLHGWMAQDQARPVIVAGAAGAWFWDETGKRYLDCYMYARWNMIMLAPPLVISREDLVLGLEVVDRALGHADRAVAALPASR